MNNKKKNMSELVTIISLDLWSRFFGRPLNFLNRAQWMGWFVQKAIHFCYVVKSMCWRNDFSLVRGGESTIGVKMLIWWWWRWMFSSHWSWTSEFMAKGEGGWFPTSSPSALLQLSVNKSHSSLTLFFSLSHPHSPHTHSSSGSNAKERERGERSVRGTPSLNIITHI